MHPLFHFELIDIRHAELRRAADHHRLVTAARRAGHRSGRRTAQLQEMLAGAISRRRRPIAEAEPCPP